MISSPLTGRDSLLFVYGTLRPFVDIPMAKWLRRAAHYVGPATMRGRLYDLGAYPGPARSARSRRFRRRRPVSRRAKSGACSTATSAVARGKARFVRARCVVRSLARRRKTAWVYRYCYAVVGAARISSGDYRAAPSLETR